MTRQVCRFSGSFRGGGCSNAFYITRKEAVKELERGVSTRNMPEAITVAHSYDEFRINVSSYISTYEEDELERPKTCSRSLTKKNEIAPSMKTEQKQPGKKSPRKRLPSKCENRTNRRMIFSFDRQVGTDQALRMVHECVERTPLKSVPALFAVHRDTENTHVHALFLTRDVKGKKIDLDWRAYHEISDIWNEIYCREFGLDPQVFLSRKEEMREFKRAAVKAKQSGEPLPERPARSRYPTREAFKDRTEKEKWNRSRDGEWIANKRFDRELKAAGREVKRQAAPLAQLERRLETLQELTQRLFSGEEVTYETDERRTRVRATELQRGEREPSGRTRTQPSGDLREAGAGRAVGSTTERPPITGNGGGINSRDSDVEAAARHPAVSTDANSPCSVGGGSKDQVVRESIAERKGQPQSRGEADRGGYCRTGLDAGRQGFSGDGQQARAGVTSNAAEKLSGDEICRKEYNSPFSLSAPQTFAAPINPANPFGFDPDQQGGGDGAPSADTPRADGGGGVGQAEGVESAGGADYMLRCNSITLGIPNTSNLDNTIISPVENFDPCGDVASSGFNIPVDLYSDHPLGAPSTLAETLAAIDSSQTQTDGLAALNSSQQMQPIQPQRDLAAGFRMEVEAAFNDIQEYVLDYQQTTASTIVVTENALEIDTVAEEVETAFIELLL